MSLSDLAGTGVEAQVAAVASSAYLRIPFEIQTPIEFSTLLLNMHYDDGFVAYLNGTQAAGDNVPDPIAFDSVALVDRPLPDAFTPRQFDLSDHLDLLQPGTNIPAIHAVNDAVDGADFLARPELIGAKAAPGRYLPEPTPGEPNSLGFLEFVADTTFNGDPNEFHGPGWEREDICTAVDFG